MPPRTRDRTPPPADGRVPPHNLDAERSLLGAALISAAAAQTLVADTTTEQFYASRHQHIAAAIRRLVDHDQPVDAVTVAEELRSAGLLDTIGTEEHGNGGRYIAGLLADTPSAGAAAHYARTVRDLHGLRRLLAVAGEIAEIGYSEPDDVAAALAAAQERLDQLTTSTTGDARRLNWSDIGALIDGGLKPEAATYWTRSDGARLIYAGKMHAFVGEPGSGKSWLALAVIVEVLQTGGSAIYWDCEDSDAGIVGRLITLGADPTVLADPTRFRYVRPEGKIGTIERAELGREIERMNAEVVVVDSVATCMAAQGLAEDSNDDFVAWSVFFPRYIARLGAAVVMLDHVAKDPKQRGRWARGASAKLGEIDGASYQVITKRPFDREHAGVLHLRVAKDRPADVGGQGTTAAEIHLEPSGRGARLAIRVEPHTAALHAGDTWKPTAIMGKVAQLLADAGDAGLVASAIPMLVHADAKFVREAITRLAVEGYTEERRRGRQKFLRLVRPYLEGPAPVDAPPPPLEMFPDPPDWMDAEHRASLDHLAST